MPHFAMVPAFLVRLSTVYPASAIRCNIFPQGVLFEAPLLQDCKNVCIGDAGCALSVLLKEFECKLVADPSLTL